MKIIVIVVEKFKLWRGVSLDVSIFDTIQILKERIQEKMIGNPHPNQQHLCFNGVELQDCKKSLEDYKILKPCLVYMCICMKIKVKSSADLCFPTWEMNLEAKWSDTILKVRQFIEEKKGLPTASQHLIFDGSDINLEDDETLEEIHSDIGFQDGTAIAIFLFHQELIRVQVMSTGKEFTVGLLGCDSETVMNLMDRIENHRQEGGILIEDQFLVFQGIRLAYLDIFLADYGIECGSILELYTPFDCITVKVRVPNISKTITLENVEIYSTLEELKLKIFAEMNGISENDYVEDLQLLMNEEQLVESIEDLILPGYGISDHSTLVLHFRMASGSRMMGNNL